MQKYLSSIFIGLVIIILNSCNQQKKEVIPVLDWAPAHDYYLKSLTNAIAYLDTLQSVGPKSEKSDSLFVKARVEFKKAEPFASYLNPEVGHRANGPALPVFLDDSGKIMQPIGLQKIEEDIYTGEVSNEEFERGIRLTKGLMMVLKDDITKRELNPQRFFIATHQQLLRIISLGISGFDTPVSHLGIEETIVSLKSLLKVYESSIQSIIKKKNPRLDISFKTQIAEAVKFIEIDPDFETFDRYGFIREHMNPITAHWVAIRKESGLWKGINTEPFNFDAIPFLTKMALI